VTDPRLRRGSAGIVAGGRVQRGTDRVQRQGIADRVGTGDRDQILTGRPSRRDALLFLYVPFALAVSLTFADVSDDPFITLRYAANLLHGYGLAFNPGQHVQGFTSSLHLAIATLVYLIPGGDDLFKLKLLSLVFGVLALREASLLIYGIRLPLWAKRTACLAVATSWILAFASGNALETTLLVWLLVALARRLVLDGPQQSPITLVVLAFAAVLTRLDALAPVIAMSVVGFLGEGARPHWRRVSWLAGAVAAAALTTIGAVIFFHSALPNTYYAKAMPHARSFIDGIRYMLNPHTVGGAVHGRFGSLVAAAVSLVQVVFLVAGLVAVVQRFRRCAYLVALAVGQALLILATGGDWMIGGRFLAPAEIPVIIIEVLGLVVLADLLRSHLRRTVARVVVAAGTVVLVTASWISLAAVHAPAWKIQGLSDTSLLSTGQYDPLSRVWSALPADVSCLRPGQLVAASEVGYLGFSRQDLRLLDLRGLTDHAVARDSPSSVKQPFGVADDHWFDPTSAVGQAILNEKPDLIVSLDGNPPGTILRGHYELTKQQRFGYIRARVYIRTGDRSQSRCT
jgi:hypothetical protein